MNRYRSFSPLFCGWIRPGRMAGLHAWSGCERRAGEGIQKPPDSAKPMVWWHWMNGNISKEGIKLDLEWMHRVRLGGFQNFDAALATPQVVDHRLAYMTPEWKDAFKYATTMADQLGMEEAIAGSPGWSETGGPWVPASQGMKKYVWSETLVEGGKPFSGKLAHPPSQHRSLSEHGSSRSFGRAGRRSSASAVLRRCRGGCISQAGRRCADGIVESEDDGECGCSRRGDA